MSEAVRRGRKRIEKDMPVAPVDGGIGAKNVGETVGSEERDGENPALAGMLRAGLGESQYFWNFGVTWTG